MKVIEMEDSLRDLKRALRVLLHNLAALAALALGIGANTASKRGAASNVSHADVLDYSRDFESKSVPMEFLVHRARHVRQQPHPLLVPHADCYLTLQRTV